MKLSALTKSNDLTILNWRDDPEIRTLETKIHDLSVKLSDAESERGAVSAGVERIESKLLSDRVSVLMGELSEKTVKEAEEKLSALRQEASRLTLDIDALRVAKSKISDKLKASEGAAKLRCAESLLPQYQAQVRTLLSSLETAKQANEDLRQFEQTIASLGLMGGLDFTPLSKKFRRPVAIEEVFFPSGIEPWRNHVAPLLSD